MAVLRACRIRCSPPLGLVLRPDIWNIGINVWGILHKGFSGSGGGGGRAWVSHRRICTPFRPASANTDQKSFGEVLTLATQCPAGGHLVLVRIVSQALAPCIAQTTALGLGPVAHIRRLLSAKRNTT